MKDYKDYKIDAIEWQASRPRFYIDELLPNSENDFGVIAGRLGLGKTNLSLELAICLATGDPFFGLDVEQIPVLFLHLEGNPVNITERLDKIMIRHSTPPEGYFNLKDLRYDRFTLRNNIDRLVDEMKGVKVAIIDGSKHLIAGEYTKPSRVKDFGEDLLKAMQKAGVATIVTWQIKKPHEQTRFTPGDLFSIKGAADLMEDSTFILLLEKPKPTKEGKVTIYPPDTWINMYFAKAREARGELKNQNLIYVHDTCEFKERIL